MNSSTPPSNGPNPTQAKPEELQGAVLSFDEFAAARATWNDLVASDAHPLPFLRHEWLVVWWKHFGAGLEFAAPVVRKGEALVAAVPLGLRRVRVCGVPVTVAEIVGTSPVPTRGMGLSDKSDVLVRGAAPQALAALAEGVLRLLGRADVVHLKGIGEASAISEVLKAAAAGRVVDCQARSVSPYLALSGSWDAYLSSRSGNFRKHLRKYHRNLGKQGSVEIVRFKPGDDCDVWFSEIESINDDSWKADRGTNLLRHPRVRAFMAELVREAGNAGLLDLRLLRLDGRALAYELCFDIGGRIFSYNGSFRKDTANLSPGTVLTAAIIESACDRGHTEYDMLRGEEAYKSRWSATLRSESELTIRRAGLGATLYTTLGVKAKNRLKRSARLSDLDDRLTGWIARLGR